MIGPTPCDDAPTLDPVVFPPTGGTGPRRRADPRRSSPPARRSMTIEDHRAWPLQPAEAEIERNTLTEWIGLRLPDTAPLLHFSRQLAMVGWAPRVPVG